MATVINDNFMVCSDCIQAIANDDFSSLNYYYTEAEAAQRMDDIRNGILQSGGNICLGDSNLDKEYSTAPCNCCGSLLMGARLMGARYHCIVLSNDTKDNSTARYIAVQFERVEKSEELRLKIRASNGEETHWLNVTTEQLEKIKQILAE